MKGASRSAAGRGGGPGGPAAHSAHEPCGAQDKAVSTAAVTGVYRPKGNSGNDAITVTVASLKGVVTWWRVGLHATPASERGAPPTFTVTTGRPPPSRAVWVTA